MPETIVIIVAMKREIDPLLSSWRRRGRIVERIGLDAGMGPAFLCGSTVIYCGGIGPARAAAAATYAVAHHQPAVLVSAGLAGAVSPSGKVGDVVCPATVIDARSRQPFSVRDSAALGVLITTDTVVSREQKLAFQRQDHAVAVDMEAAAVAEVAASAGVRFFALKAISDPLDFPMPPLDRFIDPEGKLDLLHLMRWAALRPATWRALATLGRNSRKAAEELARELEQMLVKL